MAVPNWIYISNTSGSSGTTTITVSAGTNERQEDLISMLSVSSDFRQKSLYIKQEKKTRNYLTMEFLNSGNMYWKNSNNDIAKTIQYSKNGSPWTNITSTQTGTSFNVNAGDIVQFRGTNAGYGDIYNYSYNYFSGSPDYNIYGYLSSLMYGDSFENYDEITENYAFFSLFYGNNVIDASNLIFPSNTTEGCYESMFRNCRKLTTAPSLPATTLANQCYRAMFQSCYSIKTLPSNYLPATTLANSCYSLMFNNCSGLTNTPDLPATTLANNCYNDMFSACRSLTTVPSSLPATTLATYCYNYMFENCTSLTTAPELPASTLVLNCYGRMFAGCTGLTTAPDLPAKTLVQGCYLGMFSGCTNLNYIKCLATDISASACTSNWVNNVAPSGTFIRAASMIDWSVNSVNGIPIGWTNKYLSQYLTFDILSSGTITWIKSNIFASDRTIEYSKDNGSTWTSITSSRDGVSFSVNSGDKVQFRGTNAHFATSNVNYTYFQTTCNFKVNGNIMSLLYGDNFASQNTLQSSSTFCCLFINNTGLTDAEFLELPATAIKGSCYEGLFSGCTSLAKAPAILPSTAMEYECYENMFGGCTSLTTAPILPATSLSNSCYSGMFDGCSSLNYIKAMFTTTPGVAYTSNWVRNVASSGTFVKNSSATWTTTGNNGVPTNWTIETV